jgi:guanylate kinase
MSRLLTEKEAKQFATLLQNYQLNNEVLDQFRSSKFGVIAGPAGAGKDTLRDALIQKYPDKYLPILSTTTRPPRDGEVDGQIYHFREIGEVKEGLKKHEFFQTALVHGQQISCLHVDEIRKLQLGQWGLSILIPSTERELRDIKPDIKTIFLIPPSLDVLKSRMQAERTLGADEVNRRLQAGRKEMSTALEEPGYYCIVSDDISKMTAKAHELLQTQKRNSTEDRRARETIQHVLDSYYL